MQIQGSQEWGRGWSVPSSHGLATQSIVNGWHPEELKLLHWNEFNIWIIGGWEACAKLVAQYYMRREQWWHCHLPQQRTPVCLRAEGSSQEPIPGRWEVGRGRTMYVLRCQSYCIYSTVPSDLACNFQTINLNIKLLRISKQNIKY